MDQITERWKEKESGLESVPARLGLEEEGRQTNIRAVWDADVLVFLDKRHSKHDTVHLLWNQFLDDSIILVLFCLKS